MKRFLSVAIVLMACLPVGVSVVGCGVNLTPWCDVTHTQRINQVATIQLQPQFGNVSLAYTQTQLMGTPRALNCDGDPVASAKFNWQSSNPSLLDVSTSGNLCSGTWNRATGGGIADFTICSPPTNETIESLLAAGGNSYSQFYVNITASANGISSNPVTVYSHPQVTAAFGYTVTGSSSTSAAPLCLTPSPISCDGVATSSLPPQQCYSQASTVPVTYCAVVCAEGLTDSSGTYGLVDVTPAVGTIRFQPSNINVVLFNSDAVAQPVSPGATLVTASVSGVTAAAGVYSTCAPSSMTLESSEDVTDPVFQLPVNQSQPLYLNVVDTTGQSINPLGVTYTSTSPRTLNVSASGVAQPKFGGNGDIYAACLPPSCNPSPLNDIGLFATSLSPSNPVAGGGSGVSITSNPINVVTPGTETSYAYMANFDVTDYPNANYFVVYNSSTNTTSPISTPYRPNSMVLSQDYSKLFIGTNLGLLTYGANSTVGLQNTNQNVPGRVVAVSPDDSTLIISGNTNYLDPALGSPVIYLYNINSGTYTTIGGTAYSAQWSADGNTVYIAGGDQEYVYSKVTGWSQYPVANNATNVYDVAALIPGVGAFFGGADVSARTYCPDTAVSPAIYSPQTTVTTQPAERLGISEDGMHLFGAVSAAGGNFNDFCIGIPTNLGNGTTGSTTSPPNCTPAPVAPVASCSPNNSFAVTATNTTASAPVPAGYAVTSVPVASTSVCSVDPANPLCNETATSGSGNSAVPATTYTAFVTYSNCINTQAPNESCPAVPAANGQLPYYLVTSGAPGTTGSLQLSNPSSAVAPIAPLAAAITPDNTFAYVTTSGDNAIHFVTISNSSANPGVPTENTAVNPPVAVGLPDGQGDGNFLPADKILVRPLRAN